METTSIKKSKRIDLSTLDAGVKIPPQAVGIEEAILGACMLEKTAFDRCAMMKPEYFYMDEHQVIFKSFRDLANKSKPIDLLTVEEQLRVNGDLDLIGGMYKLAKITSKVSSAANIEYHCAIVYQKWGLREIIRISGEALSQAYEPDTDLFELQTSVSSQLDLITVSDNREMEDLWTVVKARLNEIEVIQSSGVTTTGIPTGWPKIDNILHGWQKSDLVILAARPGQGKSAMIGCILMNVAKQGIPVVLFSLEMGRYQFADRIISAETGIGGLYLKKADINQTEWGIIGSTNFSYPLFIDDSPSSSLNILRSKIRRAVRNGAKLVAVDYLQLMQAKEKGDNRQQEVGKISRGLKLLAKELQVPIIALAQLSREAEGVQPQLNHLREAGDIEQDADIVIFLYDENAHNKEIQDPVIEFIVAKHRAGSVGVRMMKFKKPTQKFEEYNDGFN